MAAELNKKIVRACYPHAYCYRPSTLGRVKHVIVKDFSNSPNKWLSGEHYSEDAAWKRAAEEVQKAAIRRKLRSI
jgi:hypothetical protein